MKSFRELFASISIAETKVIAVAGAHDRDVVLALKKAHECFHIRAKLLGDAEKIEELLLQDDADIPEFEIYDFPDDRSSVREAVRLVHEGRADILMKGFVDSTVFLKEILDPEFGLRVENQYIATIAVMETDRGFLFLTDPGFMPAPDLKVKKALLEQAAETARKLGINIPKVAVLSAAEKVNPKMKSSVEALALKEMYQRGEIPCCVVDGPLSLDIAVSRRAALHKQYEGIIRGDADILIMPSLEAGNILYKSMVHFAHMETGGIITGASVPVVFTSRSDSAQTKLNTIAFACSLAEV